MYLTLQSGVNNINAISESVSGEMGYIQSGAGQFGIFVWAPTPVTIHARLANGTWDNLGSTTTEDKTMSIYFEDYQAIHVTADSGTVVARMSYIETARVTAGSMQTTNDIPEIPAYSAADAGSVLSTDNSGNLVWVPLSSLGAEAIREFQSTVYVEENEESGGGEGGGGGGPAGIEQHGDSVILEGQQGVSYLNQVISSSEYLWESGVNNGQFSVAKIGAGVDNERYFLFTESFTPSEMANDTEKIFRFNFTSTSPGYMRFGMMAENDSVSFTDSDSDENAVLSSTCRQNKKAGVYTKDSTLSTNAGNSTGGRALVFAKDASGNLTVKLKAYNFTHGYYTDRYTFTNNATFNANFDATQPLRFFVYYSEQHNTVLFNNYSTFTQ